jgi:hypothetical protein
MNGSSFDDAAVHLHYSKTCFNRAWTLIEKTDRTPAEDEAMILLNQASLWHWSQRPDCTDRHWAIGYWQASRIRALVGHVQEAMRYAVLSLDHSGSLAPYYQANGYEALARAALVGGDVDAARTHAARAREFLQAIDDPEEREYLIADLASLP